MYPTGIRTSVYTRTAPSRARAYISQIKRPLGLLITKESFLLEMHHLFGSKLPVAFVSATITPDHQIVRYRNKVNPEEKDLHFDTEWKIYTHYQIKDGEMIPARFPE